MKQIITLFLFLLVANVSFAQTNVSGNQSGVWDLDGSPYLVTDHLTILAGQALIIEAGVEVRFQGYYKFNVLGDLQAIGTESATILFTAENHATGWGGLRVDSSDLIKLTHCRIEHGFASGDYPDMHGGAMALLSSNAVVENCVFADNSTSDNSGMGGAIYAINATQTSFKNTTFIRNHAFGEGGAIKFSAGSDVSIIDSDFIENYCSYGGGAISFYGTYGAMIKGSTFVGNYTNFSDGGAIHTLGAGNRLYFVNSTLTNNSALNGDAGAVSLNYTSAFFVNTIVYQNPGTYSDDVFIGVASSAEVYYSNLPMPSGATGHHNIDQDPLFIDAANYNLSLSEASQCVDAGINFLEAGGVTLVDMGPSQYHGNLPDMGAKEYIPDIIFINNFE